MHRCLCITDIQVHIFGRPTPESCAVLARTCTTFYDEAMNVVWAKVDSFVPFARCMPSSALRISITPQAPGIASSDTATIDFSEELQPSDWQSFCKHAHRVQTFTDSNFIAIGTYLRRVYYQLVPNALRTLVGFVHEHGCLFPSLETLQVEADALLPKYLPYLSRHTLLSLKICSIHTPEEEIADIYVDWSEIVPLMRTAWPRLRSIELDAEAFLYSESLSHESDPYTQIMAPWLKTLLHLQSLDARLVPHPSILDTLSDLPLLHTLKLDRPHFDSEPQSQVISGAKLSPLPSTCFPSLRTLRIHESVPELELGSSVSLLQAFRHSQTLTNLDITFYTAQSSSQSTIGFSAIFETISYISLLEILHITLPTSEGLGLNNPENNKSALSGGLLSLLYPLQRLRELELGAWGELTVCAELDVTIDDQDLRDAAAAWPYLQVLEFARSRTPPRITLAGIQTLYNRCPYLWRVTMHINSNLPTVVRSGRIRLDLPPPDDKRRRVYFAYLRLTVTLPQEEEAGWDWLDSAHRISIATRLMIPQLYSLMADRQPHVDGRWGQEVSRMWRVCKRSTTEKVRSWLV